jgi:hypothetical protein
MTKTARTVPRPFALHWGRGQIVEEATYVGQYHEPSLQLLEYEDGSLSVRFCYYDRRGRFQRSPVIVGKRELAGLRRSLQKTPRLRTLLRKLVSA